MKQNYRFKVNPEMPSDERIESFKDFDALMAKHSGNSKKRGATVLRMLSYAAGIAAVFAAVILYFQQEDGNTKFLKEQKAYFAAQPFINPPIPSIQNELVSNTINAKRGGLIKEKSVQFSVPQNAFVDTNGKDVVGDVNLHFREMHDFVDFFISGIPMTYDSAGTTYQLESAGMIEVYAEQNGEKVQLKPETPIEVELISQIRIPANSKVPKFNVYKLDIEARNWSYEDVDKVQFVDYKEASIAKRSKETKQALLALSKETTERLSEIEASIPMPLEPQKPQPPNGNNFSFDLDIQKADFMTGLSEAEKDVFNQYKDAVWQVHPEETVTSDKMKREWEDMKLRPVNKTDFELKLINKEETLTVRVVPVLSGLALQSALEKYNKEYEIYQENLAARTAKIENQKLALKNQMSVKRQEIFAEAGEPMVKKSDLVTRKIVNRFTVNSFGIWNCDRPYLQEGELIKGSLKNSDSELFANHTAYIVNETRNSVVRFHATKESQFRFNKDSKNMLWLVTNEQKLAVFRPDDFEALETEDWKMEDLTLVMEEVQQEFDSESELREILNL